MAEARRERARSNARRSSVAEQQHTTALENAEHQLQRLVSRPAFENSSNPLASVVKLALAAPLPHDDDDNGSAEAPSVAMPGQVVEEDPLGEVNGSVDATMDVSRVLETSCNPPDAVDDATFLPDVATSPPDMATSPPDVSTTSGVLPAVLPASDMAPPPLPPSPPDIDPCYIPDPPSYEGEGGRVSPPDIRFVCAVLRHTAPHITHCEPLGC